MDKLELRYVVGYNWRVLNTTTNKYITGCLSYKNCEKYIEKCNEKVVVKKDLFYYFCKGQSIIQ